VCEFSGIVDNPSLYTSNCGHSKNDSFAIQDLFENMKVVFQNVLPHIHTPGKTGRFASRCDESSGVVYFDCVEG
jgi:hypothetical protein